MQPGPAPLTPNVDIISEATQPRGWAAGLPSPGGRSRSLRVRGGTGLHRSPGQRDPPLLEPKSSSLPACHLVPQGTQKASGQGCSRIGPWRTPMWGKRLTHMHFPTPHFRSQEAVNSEPQLQTGEANGPRPQKAPETTQRGSSDTSRCQTSPRPRKHSRIKPKSPKERYSSKRDSPSGHVEWDRVPPVSQPVRVKHSANTTHREATGHMPRGSSECQVLGREREWRNRRRAGARGSPTTAAPSSANAPRALDREWGHTRAMPKVTGDTLSEHVTQAAKMLTASLKCCYPPGIPSEEQVPPNTWLAPRRGDGPRESAALPGSKAWPPVACDRSVPG